MRIEIKEKISFGFIMIIIATIMFFFNDSYSQTKTLQDLINEYNQKAEAYPKAVYQGKILSSMNSDIFPSPYSYLSKVDGKYVLPVHKSGSSYLARSEDGRTNWSYTPSNFRYGCVIYDKTDYVGASHIWFNNQSFFIFSRSNPSGTTFNDIYLHRTPHGEDISILKVGTEYRAYARDSVPPAVRTIGVMQSPDLIHWTEFKVILTPDIYDNGREFYSMSVIQTPKGFFGFINVYNPVNNKMTIRLVFSVDGLSNWKWLHNRNPIIPLEDREQLYASASVIGDEVYIVTISAKFNHSEENRNGRYYYTELWTIDKEILFKYLDF